jgi:hypothetical protein
MPMKAAPAWWRTLFSASTNAAYANNRCSPRVGEHRFYAMADGVDRAVACRFLCQQALPHLPETLPTCRRASLSAPATAAANAGSPRVFPWRPPPHMPAVIAFSLGDRRRRCWQSSRFPLATPAAPRRRSVRGKRCRPKLRLPLWSRWRRVHTRLCVCGRAGDVARERIASRGESHARAMRR